MIELPERPALVVIDVQMGFDDPRWGHRNNPSAESKIAKLIAVWRDAGNPIVHVHHNSLSPTGYFRPGTPGNAVKEEARPLPGEPVYRKTVNSAFIGTTLEADLRRAEIVALVIVGLTTQHCVSTTTRMADNLGFDTYIVSDATAAFDQIGIDGLPRLADEVHAGALSDLNGEFGTVVTTEGVLEAMHSQK
jgi:nicotinamidase-related amidase